MEGVPDFCEIANKQLKSIDATKSYQIREGLYKSVFPKIIDEKRNFNIFFIDGNHKKEDTLGYFNALKSISEIPSIMIFDDINWSIGMQELWAIIKQDKDISYSIDFFKWGIIVIDKSKSKVFSNFKFHLQY